MARRARFAWRLEKDSGVFLIRVFLKGEANDVKYLLILGLASTALLEAQTGTFEKQIVIAGPGEMGEFAGPTSIRYIGIEAGNLGKTVTGAPFSGKQVTEETQALADGNKIHHTISSQFYRDGQGRTRVERTFSAVGPWSSGEPKTHVTIHDPVAGVTYLLNPEAQTYSKLPRNAPPPLPDPAAVQMKFRAEAKSRGANVVFSTGGIAGGIVQTATVASQEQPAPQDLGTKQIQGLQCKGTRTTVTIPAGSIGNDLAISIVDERWVSSDLGMVIESTHTDPRMGDVSVHFENISRAEPDSSLFQPPAGYTEDANSGNSLMHVGPPPPPPDAQ